MSGRLSYHVEQPCRAPAIEVYDALLDFDRYPDWMPGVLEAEWEYPGNASNRQGAIRRLRKRDLTVREAIVDTSRPRRHTYLALSGAPVRKYRSDIVIDDRADGCYITWAATFESRVPGVGKLQQRSIRAAIVKTAAALAHRAEHMP